MRKSVGPDEFGSKLDDLLHRVRPRLSTTSPATGNGGHRMVCRRRR